MSTDTIVRGAKLRAHVAKHFPTVDATSDADLKTFLAGDGNKAALGVKASLSDSDIDKLIDECFGADDDDNSDD